MNQPELLVPAGTYEKMTYAFAYGADAVYAGVPKYSLRARDNDFTEQRLREAIAYAHGLKKKIYLTMNIYPHNRKLAGFTEMLDRVAEMKPDGLIMADPGMILVARERQPQLDIHLSTQSNTVNWQTVRFWKEKGLKRIILSREISLDEIREMRRRVPDIELEAFVHGAICIAYSGRCLLSNYFNHRDANQGTCTNACRWEYKLYRESDSVQQQDNNYQPLKGQYYLEENERPGSLMAVDEDEHGTYIMNSRDLSAIHLLREMSAAGIDSFKVEGRTKSVYYLSVITRAYRMAMDSLKNDGVVPQEVQDEVFAVANRGYISGFLERNPLKDGQNYEQGHSYRQSRLFAGIVGSWDESMGQAAVQVRNRFEVGDQLELISPGQTRIFTVNEMFDEEGKAIDTAHGGGRDIRLPLPESPRPYALLRKIVNDDNHKV